MAFTTSKKRIIIYISVWLIILCSFLFMGAKAYRQATMLNLRNAADSLMPLVELATESGGNYGGNYIEAKKSHAEMIKKYVDHMNERNVSFLLRLPPFSKKNIVKYLEEIAEELGKEVHSKDEARKKIEQAAKSIVQFLAELEFFTEEQIIAFKSEVMSKEIKDALKESLKEAHDRAEIYANDLNVANAEEACMTNRKAIVYLYLARFGYQEIIDQEMLRRFRTDLNQAIYYNRLLQQTEAVKIGKDKAGSDYELLDRHSDSEIRRLWLLQAIIENDVEQTQVLLRIAIKKAFPDIQF